MEGTTLESKDNQSRRKDLFALKFSEGQETVGQVYMPSIINNWGSSLVTQSHWVQHPSRPPYITGF